MARLADMNQRLRDEQRANILAAARTVFLHKGSAATIADIAAEASISQGLAYRYFASKEAIFHELIEEAIKAGPKGLHRFLEMPEPPEKRLALLVSRLIETRRTQPGFFQVLDQAQSLVTLPDDLRERLHQQQHTFLDVLRQLIIEGQGTGAVAAGDPDQIVIALAACLEGMTKWAARNPEWFHHHAPDADVVLRLLKQHSSQP